MTINVQQVNNPFVLGQIGGSYNLGVSVGEIEELYELLGYTESEDMASQLISSAGFGMLGAIPEVVKSVKYKDDITAAYKIAVSISDNKFEQMNLSNNFEDLLINETKVCNKANGNNIWSKIKNWWNNSNSSSGAVSTQNASTTNMATDGVYHDLLGIRKETDGIKVDALVEDLTIKPKARNATNIEANMKNVTQTIAGSVVDTNSTSTSFSTIKDINNIQQNTISDKVKTLDKVAGSSVSNVKACSKSLAKEAFGGWGIALTTISGLLSELPEIITAFKSGSNEGWAQLGRSLGTIAISDIGLSAVGQILGGTLGFALGGFIGPVGASIGSAIGKAVGTSLGSFLGRKLSSLVFGKSASEQQQEEQVTQQAKATASSQTDLQTLLSQAKEQAAAETDSNKANKILAQVQAIENKLLNTTLTTTQSTYTNPFVTV